MIRLTATLDAKALSAQVSRRLPQALARALTKTALDARDAVRQELPQRFTLRRPWVVQGIQARPADAKGLKAAVGSRDAFLVWQEVGGLRVGKNAIPLGPIANIARSQVVPKRLWPGRMLKERGVFIRKGLVLKRQGRDVQPLWMLKRAQPVKARMGMRETVSRVVERRFAEQLRRAWQR